MMNTLEMAFNRIWVKNYPRDVSPDITIPDNKSVYDLFEEAASRFGGNTAVIFLDSRYSFRELLGYVERMSAALRRLGVGKGDRVAIYLPNSIQFIIAYYATLRLGAVVTPMNPLYSPREIEYQVNKTEAKVIFALDILYNNVHQVIDNTGIRHAVVCNIADFLPGFKRTLGKVLKKIPTAPLPRDDRIINFMDLLKGDWEAHAKAAVNPREDLLSLQFTGGTTGLPKGVMLTHYNIVANIYQMHEFIKQYLEDGRETFVALLPFYHIYGQSVILGAGLTKGNTLLVFPRLELEQFIKALARYKATIFPGVPTLFNAMAKHPLTRQVDLSSLKLVISGADTLPVEVAREFERVVGKRIVEGYGLTETSPVTHINPPENTRYGSFGVPVSNTYAAVINPENLDFLPVGEAGELVVSGPQVMLGYMDAEENERVFLERGGRRWFRTGDMARVDEDGYFYFVDRIKDLIKHKGFSVFPAEVEAILYEHPAVKEAAVVGVPDERYGQRIVAAVVLKPEKKGEVTADELSKYCGERLAEYKRPSEFIFLDELPKTPVGKVLRRAVRDMLQQRR